MANNDSELRGIGGWLAFFLVTLGIVTPVSSLASVAVLSADSDVAASYGELWDRLLIFEWAIAGVAAAAGWVTVWLFFNARRWATIRLAVAVLWGLAALGLVGEPLVVSLLGGIAFGDIFAEAPADFVRPLVYSSIWTAYLLKSERVANTYPRDGSVHEVVAAFE
jgi:hypothetical protein